MICPKCQYEQSDGHEECPKCGIIYEKFQNHQTLLKTENHNTISADNRYLEKDISSPYFKGIIKELLFSVQPDINPYIFSGRFILLIVLLFWGGTLVFTSVSSNYAGLSFLHLVNLPFHEAGHIIFKPFGQFIASLGGTLGQIIMPVICMVTLLLKTRDPYGASITFWWFGENFLDIAPYINDARAGRLMLLGGNTGQDAPYGFHDWEYLLTESGFIRYDHIIAKISHFSGSTIMLVAIAWGSYLLYNQYKNLR